jgi:type I restriction enzyme S subunit
MVYAMNCRYYRHQVEQAISGAEGMANNLPLSSLKDFRFALPPMVEASAIANHIDAETSAIDRRVERLEAEIQLLREYRTRLIAEVVTGRLDVRNAAASLPEVNQRALADEPIDEADELDTADEEETEA